MSTPEPVTLPSGLFEQAPCGMALLDPAGRINWANQAMAELLGVTTDALSGQSAEQLPGHASKVLFADQPLVHFQGAEGERWLQRETRAGEMESLLIIHDVTDRQRLDSENRRLRKQVEDLKLNDDLTGLPNRRAITQALDLQISRSRRYQNPLSVVLVHIGVPEHHLDRLNGEFDQIVLGVSRFLRDRLRWVDQIGRWDENVFILVLPETEKNDADHLVEKIRNEQSSIQLQPPFEEIHPVLSFGTGYWQKGDDMRTLLRQVSQDLAGE